MIEFENLVEQIRSCNLCPLSQTRTNAVPGEGSLTASIMFIGEAPGYYEDRDGRPFVGQAGQLLDRLLSSIGLDRKTVYITNMVKCRPPNNRDPLPGETSKCAPYLNLQLDMVAPRIIVSLGRHAFSKFFPGEPIGKARGKTRIWNGLAVYPMYHPAAALRNPKLLSVLEEDFRNLSSLLNQPLISDEVLSAPSKQLSLFE